MYAVVAAGTTARPLMTTRVEPSMFMPVIVAPGSPVSVRSASGPPRARIETVPYGAGGHLDHVAGPRERERRREIEVARHVHGRGARGAGCGQRHAQSEGSYPRPEPSLFTIGDANKVGPPEIPRRQPTSRRISGPTGRSTVPCWSYANEAQSADRDLRLGGSRVVERGALGGPGTFSEWRSTAESQAIIHPVAALIRSSSLSGACG